MLLEPPIFKIDSIVKLRVCH